MRASRRRDRGSILVLALLVSAAASVAGMYMVLTSDLRVRANRYLSRAADASRVALSGLQPSREHLAGNPGWTGADFSDPVEPSQSVSVSVVSTGIYRARATCLGVVGDATQGIAADLRAVPHKSIDFNVFSATTVEFDNASTGGYVRANGDVTAVGSIDFSGNLETTSGSAVTIQIPSEQIRLDPDPMLPPPASVPYYASLASPLVLLPIDIDTGALVLENQTLRPNFNPFGATNPNGAYLIDAGGLNVIVRNVYIEGLLVIRNSPLVLIEQGFHLERVEQGLASLMVEGGLDLRLQNPLDETSSLIDYNGDGDLFDLFLPSVEGIVYASGLFEGPYGGTIAGAIVAGQVRIKGMPNLIDSTALDSQPVYEFIEQGSWDVVAGSIGRTL